MTLECTIVFSLALVGVVSLILTSAAVVVLILGTFNCIDVQVEEDGVDVDDGGEQEE